MEILDMDTRVREVAGSLLLICSAAAWLSRSGETVHLVQLVVTTENQFCLHWFPTAPWEHQQVLQHACVCQVEALQPRRIIHRGGARSQTIGAVLRLWGVLFSLGKN